jgi:hypothetical protein
MNRWIGNLWGDQEQVSLLKIQPTETIFKHEVKYHNEIYIFSMC